MEVNFESKVSSSRIRISQNLDLLYEYISENKVGKTLIITDNNILSIYSEIWKSPDIYYFAIEPGEKSKSFSVVNQIYNFLSQKNFSKCDAIVAFGGGVVGDIAGYVASTFLRGMKLIQMPTTLLAMVDSSIGGKCGINFNGIKNVIGSIYQPKINFINPTFIESLPDKQIREGLAEIIIHSVIGSNVLFQYVSKNIDFIQDKKIAVMQHLIKENCAIKGSIVAADENDAGIRNVLNLGHTIGHGLEAESKYRLSHGECVAIGLVGAFILSDKLHLLEKYDDIHNVKSLLGKVGLPVNYSGFSPHKIIHKIKHDKKRSSDKFNVIVPNKIGKVQIVKLDNLDQIMDTLWELKQDR